ncbi:MAG: hypothetical protein A2W22_05935 [Candidatus Levybacteria bacterium RBG_16_35_11]|nr:MAG: hypothetical protein A2W22_05935 [Candidatus Levybacteria bacterium RBG_16_35_11]
MVDVELEGVYPVDDPNDLPIKIVDLGQGSIFVKGNIEGEAISELADVNVEEDLPRAVVSLSVWENSGDAKLLDRQVLMGSTTQLTEQGETPIHVFDPYTVRLLNMTEDALRAGVETDGYLWQVARFLGGNAVANKFLKEEDASPELQVEYQGVDRFEEPRRRQFSINGLVDLYVGNLKFNVSFAQKLKFNK